MKRLIPTFVLAMLPPLFSMVCNINLNSVSAQDVTFFTSKEGLVNSCIQSIHEDSRHNIWIATRNGLNRYDGVSMHTYHHDKDKPNTPVNDVVLHVYDYDRNHILIGTDNGLQVYDYLTDGFTPVPYISLEGDTVRPHISRICELSHGEIYVCAPGSGCAIVRKDSEGRIYARQVQNFLYADSDISPVALLNDRKGRVWAIGRDRNVYLRKGNDCVKVLSTGQTVDICQSQMGKVYLGDQERGLMVYDEKTSGFKPLLPEGNFRNIWRIRPWSDNRIFICTDGQGLKVYDEKTGQLTQSQIQINNFNLASSNVKDVACDVYGNVWVGVYWKGVMMKPASFSLFEYIGRNSISKNTIGGNSVTSLSQSSLGGIWVATDHDGFYHVTDNGTQSTHYSPSTTAGAATFNALREDGKGRLWMGGFTDGLWSMDLKTGKISAFGSYVAGIFSMFSPRPGNIWIATVGSGFYHLDTERNELIHYDAVCPKLRRPDNFAPNRYTYSVIQKGNSLYVGTVSGIQIYRCVEDNCLEYVNTILYDYNVFCFCQDPNRKDILWVGTDKGLISIDTKTLSNTKYTKAAGLPSNSIGSIAFLGKELWIATASGLSNYANSKFMNYYNEDGIQDNEFMPRAVCESEGNLYFGGIDGVTYFNDKKKDTRVGGEMLDSLHIVELCLSNAPVHAGDLSGKYEILDCYIDDAQTINLADDENFISLDVTLPGMKSGRILYEYSFNGKQWLCQNQGHRILLQDLETGTHKLRLRARMGERTSPERLLTIVIHDPWYASTLAYVLYFAFLILLAFIAIHYVRQQMAARRVLSRHRQQHQINETRIQFFMNISHEIRTPMTLIMAPIEKLITTDPDPGRQQNYQLIKQNGNRVLRLVNQILDIRKIEMGQFQLDCTPQDVVKLLQGVCNVFSNTAQMHSIDFQFIHDGIEQLVSSVDTENFDKIMMNLLSNAFKFTPDGGSIIVELQEDKSASSPAYTISVTDSGIGISDEDKPKVFQRFFSAVHQNGYVGTGIGMNLTSLLVKLHNGDIQVMDNPEGAGARFVVTLPLVTVDNSDISVTDSVPATSSTSDLHSEPSIPDNRKQQKGASVVLVDDEPSIREYVQKELSSDMSISCFSNGQEAWDYILESPEKVSLVISDVMMPVMDGTELCHNIKSRPITNHIPVILITALNADKDRIAGLKTGADAYITKPFNIDVLHTTATNLISSHHILQTKYTSGERAKEIIENVEIISPDEKLLDRALKAINANLDNSEFTIEEFADLVGVSRVHLYRKMKELTGQSPRDYIRNIRLQEAARLLTDKHLDISEVADRTGFKSLSAFSTTFKDLYGVSPTEYMKKNKKN